MRQLTAFCFLLSFISGSKLFASEKIDVLYWLINEVRAAHHLPNIYYGDIVAEGAFNHAQDMALRNYFGHYTPEGWGVGTRLYGLGLGHEYYVMENIAAGMDDPHEVFDVWMASPPHKAHILSPGIKTAGIAHYYRESSMHRHYWVLISSNRPD